ncbi:GNAT family N-acetyltransferase [uncultured Paracoccus sp.]|uniref:GNAT family N-acetyltransferase n=1 Tax=uncultured Paracoccus sp. TaxID=189685 RepID=UPI0026224172|nr:GNAT family N-acetyltransferase [uncultured Paracoccus sp.]
MLFDRHVLAMHEDTPPESVHMLPRHALAEGGITFFVMREGGTPVAMGAVKQLSPAEGEIKSMHVLAEVRGRGLSAKLLDSLLDHARAAGMTRVSLETGVQPSFAAARALYRRAGFVPCPPFGGYGPDPNSLFMTLSL